MVLRRVQKYFCRYISHNSLLYYLYNVEVVISNYYILAIFNPVLGLLLTGQNLSEHCDFSLSPNFSRKSVSFGQCWHKISCRETDLWTSNKFLWYLSHYRGFLFCGSWKLANFRGGKRKYSVIYTDFGHKLSDGNGNIIF